MPKVMDFGFWILDYNFQFEKKNAKNCLLSILGFLIFDFYAPVLAGIISSFKNPS